MDYDFIVGFTLFTPKGFKTMYRHFDKLDTAKGFVSNVNIKDNSKIYVDLKYMQDKIKAKIEEIKNECKYCDFTDEFCEELLQNNNCTQGNTLKVLQSLLEKE